MYIKTKLLAFLLCISTLQAAEYKVSIKGHSAGTAKLLMATEQDRYEVSLTLFPNAVVRMFGIKGMSDVSRGSLVDGHYFPRSYRRTDTSGKLLFSVDFDNDVAKKKNKGKVSVVGINPNGQDPLTQIAQITHDLQKGALAPEYHLITEKTQRVFTAKLTHSDGKKLVVLTQKPKSDRIIKLWFDGDLHLYRMQKRKRGKMDFDMVEKK